eukprot:TRINITY_DN13242_c0_g1_i1.p1 TRINITY_DN13242_c0_g1~~TRINITY_DN13242_c0_g1_i1.p1  ORF type:complete len:300 (+),score=101.44 TRINITY_DN13242_c0_g1_i1:135-902(+)
MLRSLVGSEMCIRDRYQRRVRGRTSGSMANEPHLTYFAGWGLAEQVRWMLAGAGIEFTQTAFSTNEQFVSLQESGKLLFKQLPLLEIDGLNLVQSQAMLRHVSRRSSMDGSNPAEAALNDMLCEGVRDCRGVVVMYPFQTRGMSAEQIAEYVAAVPGKISKQMSTFEQTLVEGAEGFLESGLCAADILVAELAHELLEMDPEVMAPYPKTAALYAHVVSLPQIVEYLQSDRRYPFPKTDEIRDAYVDNVNTVLGR